MEGHEQENTKCGSVEGSKGPMGQIQEITNMNTWDIPEEIHATVGALLDTNERLKKLCAEQAAVLTATVVLVIGYDQGGPPKMKDGKAFYPPVMVPLHAIMERLNDAPVFRDLPADVQQLAKSIRKDRYGIE